MPANDEEYLTVQEIADYMRISDASVYRLIHGKILEANRHGRIFRVKKSTADAYLRSTSTIREETL